MKQWNAKKEYVFWYYVWLFGMEKFKDTLYKLISWLNDSILLYTKSG